MGEPSAVDTLIIGASAAGLATAACLGVAKVPYRLLEAAPHVGASWRGHYDRLHLHTSRGLSALPGMPLPRSYPTYPSRDQVVEYLEAYAARLPTPPQLGERVTRVRRDGDGATAAWVTESAGGRYRSRHVVVATGNARVPNEPRWPGQDAFAGPILHSSRYRNGEKLRGQRVLIIGFGNSGGEIAIDLCEHGARPDIAVRSPVNVVPRDILGVPVLGIGIAMSVFPPRVADILSLPLLAATVGNIEKLGFRKLPYGPAEQIRRDHRIPLLDIGTLDLIRKGAIRVRPGVARFTATGVTFDGGAGEDAYDAIVLATGYRAQIADFVDGADAALDATGTPKASGHESLPGLFFCGFYVSPTGMLREIAIEAERIARSIAQARNTPS